MAIGLVRGGCGRGVLRARGWCVVSRDRVVRGSRSGQLWSRCSTVDDFMLGMAFEKIICCETKEQWSMRGNMCLMPFLL